MKVEDEVISFHYFTVGCIALPQILIVCSVEGPREGAGGIDFLVSIEKEPKTNYTQSSTRL